MARQIYDFDQYKKYLSSVIRDQPNQGHGFKSRLAKAAQCQLPYLSRVLGGDVDFSVDQADGVSRFLGHVPDERHFFLLLVQRSRAATSALREYFTEQIEAIRKRRMDLSERFQVPKTLPEEHQSTYYGRWYYAAIHILVSIPGFQTRDAVAEKLGLPLNVAAEALDFLTRYGLVVQKGGHFSLGVGRTHVGTNSPHVGKHHQNWRLQAVISLDRADGSRDQDLHYSSIVSLSKTDFHRIKTRLIEEIENCNKIISESKEEELCSLLIDFFGVGR